MATVMRPNLSVAAARLFYEIADYAREYCRDRDDLRRAASDVMDGHYDRNDGEPRELVTKGILEFVRDRDVTTGERIETWWMTDYACELMEAEAPARPAGGERETK